MYKHLVLLLNCLWLTGVIAGPLNNHIPLDLNNPPPPVVQPAAIQQPAVVQQPVVQPAAAQLPTEAEINGIVHSIVLHGNQQQGEIKFIAANTISYDCEFNDLVNFVEAEKTKASQSNQYKQLKIFVPMQVHNQSLKIINDSSSKDRVFAGLIICVDLVNNTTRIECINPVYNRASHTIPDFNIFLLKKLKQMFNGAQISTISLITVSAGYQQIAPLSAMVLTEIFENIVNETEMDLSNIDQLRSQQIRARYVGRFQGNQFANIRFDEARNNRLAAYQKPADKLEPQDIKVIVDDFLREFIYPEIFFRSAGEKIQIKDTPTLETAKAVPPSLLDHIQQRHFVNSQDLIDPDLPPNKSTQNHRATLLAGIIQDSMAKVTSKNVADQGPKSKFIAPSMDEVMKNILESIRLGIKNGTIYATYHVKDHEKSGVKSLKITIQLPLIPGAEIGVPLDGGASARIFANDQNHDNSYIFIGLTQHWVGDHWEYSLMPMTIFPSTKAGDYRPGEVVHRDGLVYDFSSNISFSGSWGGGKPQKGTIQITGAKDASYSIDTLSNHSQSTMLFEGSIFVCELGDITDPTAVVNATIFYPNGDRYTGMVRNKKRHGVGVLYNKDGTILRNGKWQDDACISNEEFIQLKFDKHDKGDDGDDDDQVLALNWSDALKTRSPSFASQY